MSLISPKITFDQRVFVPGEEVTGKVAINTNADYHARSVTITFTGKTLTAWKKADTSMHALKDKKAEEVHVMMSHEVWEPENENNVFPSGEYEWNFSFELPKECPASFEGRFGFVRYSVLVHVEVPNMPDIKVEAGVTVSPIADLNKIPGAAAPVQVQVEKQTQCCGCIPFRKGNVLFTISSPTLGYVAGQTVTVNGTIDNHTSSSIPSFRGSLYRRITYRDASDHQQNAKSPRVDDKKNSRQEMHTLYMSKKIPLGTAPGQSGDFTFQVDLPPVVPTIRTAYLSVEYFIRITANVSGFTCSESKADLNVFVGSEPIVRNGEKASVKRFVKSGIPSQCWSVHIRPLFNPLVPFNEVPDQ